MSVRAALRAYSARPRAVERSKPCFGIIVPPSPFTVPAGWEFVLSQPFEGVSYIATVLHNAGYPVRIIDVRMSKQPVRDAVRAAGAVDVAGIATYEDSFVFQQEVIRRIKQVHPSKPVVAGGSLVTSVPSVFMKNTRADVAVLGEGELTVLELMDVFRSRSPEALGSVRGICYKDGTGDIRFTGQRPPMKRLSALPVMNLSLWPQVKKEPRVKEIFFSHSRGCYMNCSFCFRTIPQLSEKSIAQVERELAELYDTHAFEFIYFVDLTFAIDKKRTLDICSVVRRLNVRWSCMCRVQNMDREMLRAMKKAGCEYILYGFESLSPDILRRAHKGITPREIEAAVRMTRDAGIRVAGLFILGLPGETKQTLRTVVDFIRKHGTACRVKYLSAIPGTALYRQGLETGLIRDEAAHLRWLSKERGSIDDEFINFTAVPDRYLRQTYRRISELYIRGPQYGPS